MEVNIVELMISVFSETSMHNMASLQGVRETGEPKEGKPEPKEEWL